jgi:hypothetical protein
MAIVLEHLADGRALLRNAGAPAREPLRASDAGWNRAIGLPAAASFWA